MASRTRPRRKPQRKRRGLTRLRALARARRIVKALAEAYGEGTPYTVNSEWVKRPVSANATAEYERPVILARDFDAPFPPEVAPWMDGSIWVGIRAFSDELGWTAVGNFTNDENEWRSALDQWVRGVSVDYALDTLAIRAWTIRVTEIPGKRRFEQRANAILSGAAR